MVEPAMREFRFEHVTQLRVPENECVGDATYSGGDVYSVCKKTIREWANEFFEHRVRLQFGACRKVHAPGLDAVCNQVMSGGSDDPNVRAEFSRLYDLTQIECDVASDDLAALTVLKLHFS